MIRHFRRAFMRGLAQSFGGYIQRAYVAGYREAERAHRVPVVSADSMVRIRVTNYVDTVSRQARERRR